MAIFGTAFFFFLHHLGNQIPYDLAKQRFAAAQHPDSSHIPPENTLFGPYAYCEISLPILQMAKRRAEGANSLLDAVALKTQGPPGSPCSRLEAALNGVEQGEFAFKARYWWGARAVFAIALNHLSAKEVRELTETCLYFAYALLAVSLLLLSPKALLVVSPLVLYGAFFSGIRHFSDIVNGAPLLWTVLSPAALAFLMRSRASSSPAATGAVGIFCFFTGMVSCFLWLNGAGHAFLHITLIGMVAYFGGRHPSRPAAARDAIACVLLYLAGFAVCFWLGLIVKAALTEGVWDELWGQVIFVFLKAGQKVPSLIDTWKQYLGLFYFMAMGRQYVLAGELLAFFSLFALMASMAFAVLQILGRTGGVVNAAASGGQPGSANSRFAPSMDILWILGLLLANVPCFVMYDDVPARTASMLFVPFGLSASGLILVIFRMNGRGLMLLFGGLFCCTAILLLYMKIEERLFIKKIEGVDPSVRSLFDLYLFDEELAFVKDRCSEREIKGFFYLQVLPSHVHDLSGDHWKRGYEGMNFTFASRYYSYQHAIRNEKCILTHPLPDYDISCIRVSKGSFRAEYCTEGFRRKQERILQVIDENEPVISSHFEVYLIGDELIYAKDSCTAQDRAAKFALQVSPVDAAHLQDGSQERNRNNYDFHWYPLFLDSDGPQRCIMARPLPNYDIDLFQTWQFFSGGKALWSGEFRLRPE